MRSSCLSLLLNFSPLETRELKTAKMDHVRAPKSWVKQKQSGLTECFVCAPAPPSLPCSQVGDGGLCKNMMCAYNYSGNSGPVCSFFPSPPQHSGDQTLQVTKTEDRIAAWPLQMWYEGDTSLQGKTPEISVMTCGWIVLLTTPVHGTRWRRTESCTRPCSSPLLWPTGVSRGQLTAPPWTSVLSFLKGDYFTQFWILNPFQHINLFHSMKSDIENENSK